MGTKRKSTINFLRKNCVRFLLVAGIYFERSGECRRGTKNRIGQYSRSFPGMNAPVHLFHRFACEAVSSCACVLQRDHLKVAQQFFQLVGGSASECGKPDQMVCSIISKSWTHVSRSCFSADTIPGRQCMASCFFLLRQFEDALVYLNSVKVSQVSCAAAIETN